MGKARSLAAVLIVLASAGCALAPPSKVAPPAEPSDAIVIPGAPKGDHAPRPPTLLYATFQDHAVLQRDKAIPVWGQTAPGAQVSVSFAGEDAQATADSAGRWRTQLAEHAAGGPYELTARSTTGEIQTVHDVMIGDVYLCSGQSNMEMPVRNVSNYDAAFYNATNKNLRLFHVHRFTSPAPRATFGAEASWTVNSPEGINDFSGTCYYFGRALQPAADVAVGLIEDAWGGSVIQDWISTETMRGLGGYDDLLDILPLYAASPATGEKAWRAIARAWWKAHDPASAATPPWSDPAFDDSSWAEIVPTGTWREWKVPLLKTFNGIVWLRETFELTAEQAKGAATLSLGAIDSDDATWVNGVPVGFLEGYDVKRTYDVPAGTLHEGKNVLAVGVIGGAGPLAPASKMTLKLATGQIVSLTAPWRYKTSAPMSEIGHIPHVPWLNQFGLTTLYNGMILPLGPTPIRGVVWYQGESDAGQPKEYARLLPAMIENWRELFGKDVPFAVVQLPDFGPPVSKPQQSDWAELREVQRTVVAATPRAGLAVTIDIGQPDNIHPTNKEELGKRIALVLERLAYGMDVVDSGPTPVTAMRLRNTVKVSFDHVASGLVIQESNRPVSFQICNEARACRFVDAMQNGNDIDLDVSKERDAAFVRYCWADSPLCNVVNSAGLPAVPFELPITTAPGVKHGGHRRHARR